MSKINVLDISFDFSGQSDAIHPVILEDENEMILIDCGYPNFLSLVEEAALAKKINIKNLSKPELFIDIVDSKKKLFFELLAISILNF